MNSRSNPLSRRFSNADIRALIVPLLIEQFLQLLVGMVDTLMVSYAGDAVVSGVSLDSLLCGTVANVFTAFGAGGSVIVSQYIGSRDRRNSDLSAAQTVRSAFLVSLVCMVFMLVFGNSILQLLYGSSEPAVMEACRTYLWIVTLSYPANAVYNACAAIQRSMGKTRVTMVVSTCMNLINVAGNAIGVFVLHAGAAGVAVPTAVAWCFAAVVMMIRCFRKNAQVTLHMRDLLKRDAEMVRRIRKIAVPNAIETALFHLSKVMLGSIVSTFGIIQTTANGVAQTIWNFSSLASIGMGPAFVTVIGQCMGAGQPDEADYYMKKLLKITFTLSVVWNFSCIAVCPSFLKLYDISPEARALAFTMVCIHDGFSAVIQPFSMPMSNGLRATGDAKFTMMAAIVCSIIIRVILAYILGMYFKLGAVGITIAMVCDWTIKAAMIILRYRSGKWRSIKVI